MTCWHCKGDHPTSDCAQRLRQEREEAQGAPVDPWERIRHMTMDQLVTATKLCGSAQILLGHTTPEGWPFVLVIAVGRPGSERVISYAREFAEKVQAAASFTVVTTRDRP